jgi:hypothetical protein
MSCGIMGCEVTNKPWPKAADLHWPLIDTAIEKLKPLFLQQALGMDVVASFVPMRQQLNAYTKRSGGLVQLQDSGEDQLRG